MAENTVHKPFWGWLLSILGIGYIFLAALAVSGIELNYDQVGAAIMLGMILSLLNAGIKPLLLTAPEIPIIWRQVVMFILALFINILFLYFTALLADFLTIEEPINLLWGGLLIAVISTFMSLFYEIDIKYFEGFVVAIVSGVLGYGTIALIPNALGFNADWLVGLAIGMGSVTLIHGAISGITQIYNWRSPLGWIAFLSSATWGLVGTIISLLLHIVNLFFHIGSGPDYDDALSRRQNRSVYHSGFGLKPGYAFTQGTVISNMTRNDNCNLLEHEYLHVWQSLGFGPIFQGIYLGWFIVGAFFGFIIGLFMSQSLLTSVQDVAYFDNPWEVWAYSVGGSAHDAGDLCFHSFAQSP